MILTDSELRGLTCKRHGSREALAAWFGKVDKLLAYADHAITSYPYYERERPL